MEITFDFTKFNEQYRKMMDDPELQKQLSDHIIKIMSQGSPFFHPRARVGDPIPQDPIGPFADSTYTNASSGSAETQYSWRPFYGVHYRNAKAEAETPATRPVHLTECITCHVLYIATADHPLHCLLLGPGATP